MALETLKDIKKIGGFTVRRLGEDYDLFAPIVIEERSNTILFTIQNGPIKEVGVNGCQVDTIIEAAKLIILGLNKAYPCDENSCAIAHLDSALVWLDKRKKEREKRGVEGKNEL